MDLTEKQFEQQVKDLAKLYGWKYYHTWRSIHSPAGFPDCVMVRPPRLIFAELKSDKGKMTNEQMDWLISLCKVGIRCKDFLEVYIWRPSEFYSIVECLK